MADEDRGHSARRVVHVGNKRRKPIGFYGTAGGITQPMYDSESLMSRRPKKHQRNDIEIVVESAGG